MATNIITRIYGLVDPRDGKAFYIGRTKQSLRRRFDSHLSDGRNRIGVKGQKIAEIIEAGYRVEIREIATYYNLTKEEVIATEQAWIDFYSTSCEILNTQKARATFYDGWTGDRCYIWTEDLIARLGKESDSEIARDMGCDKSIVSDKRNALGIPVFKSYEWTQELISLLGKRPDNTLAKEFGIHRSVIRTKREELGIPACPSSSWYQFVQWTPELLSRLGKESDSAIAQDINCSVNIICSKRLELGLKAAKRVIEWTPELISRLGKESDAQVARDLGTVYQVVSYQREKLGIPPHKLENQSPDWRTIILPDWAESMLGKIADKDLAVMLNLKDKTIRNIRLSRGIPSWRSQQRVKQVASY